MDWEEQAPVAEPPLSQLILVIESAFKEMTAEKRDLLNLIPVGVR